MKKLFSVLALVAIIVSCSNKKEKKTDETKTDTTATTNTPTTDETTTTTTAGAGVPSFSDPEVQKFANDLGAFVTEYKKGMRDPARMGELTKNWMDWTQRSTSIVMKLANNPDELKKWNDWWAEVAKDMTPVDK